MTAIGLDDITDVAGPLGDAAAPNVSIFRASRSRFAKGMQLKLERALAPLAAFVIALAAAGGSTAQPPPTRSDTHQAAVGEHAFAPLAKTSADAAWASAVRLLERDGDDVSNLLAAAGERIELWRAACHDAAAVRDEDLTDEIHLEIRKA